MVESVLGPGGLLQKAPRPLYDWWDAEMKGGFDVPWSTQHIVDVFDRRWFWVCRDAEQKKSDDEPFLVAGRMENTSRSHWGNCLEVHVQMLYSNGKLDSKGGGWWTRNCYKPFNGNPGVKRTTVAVCDGCCCHCWVGWRGCCHASRGPSILLWLFSLLWWVLFTQNEEAIVCCSQSSLVPSISGSASKMNELLRIDHNLLPIDWGRHR